MKHLSLNTARTYLSALGHPHRLVGMPNPKATVATHKMVESVGKDCLSMLDCKPVTWPMLSSTQTVITHDHAHWESTLYRALLSMAFHLYARVGEVTCSNGSTQHTIRLENTEFSSTTVQFNFMTFKQSRNIKIYRRVLEADHSLLCTVSLLGAYLHIRPGSTSGPLFLNRDESVVTAKLLSSILWTSLQAAGMSTLGITADSLRIGAATSARGPRIPSSNYLADGTVGLTLHISSLKQWALGYRPIKSCPILIT